MSQQEIKERIIFRSKVLKWLEECYTAHKYDIDPAMRNGFASDFVEITNEQIKNLALVA